MSRRPLMSEPHRKTYRPWEPQRYRQEVRSPEAKLPEGDLVFFLLDTMAKLNTGRLYAPYEDETRGALPFDPAMMVCLLLYAYCVGVFSSCKIAQACERNLAFIAIVGQERPDFRTISDFRKLRTPHTLLARLTPLVHRIPGKNRGPGAAPPSTGTRGGRWRGPGPSAP